MVLDSAAGGHINTETQPRSYRYRYGASRGIVPVCLPQTTPLQTAGSPH